MHPRDDVATVYHELLPGAVPSVFLSHPRHKQKQTKKRPPPKSRLPPAKLRLSDLESFSKAYNVLEEHGYCASPNLVEEKLKQTKQQLHEARNELRVVKQKVKRQGAKIGNLLQAVKDQSLINEGQLDFYLKIN